MFSHATLGSRDLKRSKRFYDAILGVLGCATSKIWPDGRLRYFHGGAMLTILVPINGAAADPGNGHTLGFRVASPEIGDRWHKEGLRHGGIAIEGPPGIRQRPIGNIYLAYLRDPDGNKLCAMVKVD
jgi:catechol 2,3-dioxygenase-like lactoylglutathione lyase family enzyme